MKTYDEIKGLLLKLCKNEGLKFIETDLSNEGICYFLIDGNIAFNKNCKRFKEVSL